MQSSKLPKAARSTAGFRGGSRSRRRALLATILCAAVLLSSAQPLRAEEPEESDWVVRAAPYVWFTSLEGDVATIAGIPPADIDAGFSDIFDKLNFGAMGYAEARRDRFGVGADLLYLDITADGGGPTPAFSKAELDLKAFIGTFLGFYQFVQEEEGTADVLLGARLWATDTELTLAPGAAPGRATDDQEVWADPIVGLRGFLPLPHDFGLRAYGDVGGFGLASDITYQFIGSVNYAFSDWGTADVGYRYLKVDYDDGDYLLDVAFQGPFVGLVITF